MPFLVRQSVYPCPSVESEVEVHHPHLMVCSEQDDDCWDDLNDGRGFMPYHELQCCIDGQEWPCDVKKAHAEQRRKLHHQNKENNK